VPVLKEIVLLLMVILPRFSMPAPPELMSPVFPVIVAPVMVAVDESPM
jgi:hypothetical protein